jgi:hypothetical protein
MSSSEKCPVLAFLAYLYFTMTRDSGQTGHNEGHPILRGVQDPIAALREWGEIYTANATVSGRVGAGLPASRRSTSFATRRAA